MKVAIDATPLTLTSGGIARYVAELSKALAKQFPEDDLFLVSDQPFAIPSPCPPNLRPGTSPRNWLEKRWWLAGVELEISRIGAALFHGTNFVVPWLPLQPSVATIHDLAPWLYPAERQAGARFVRGRAPYALGLGLATMIITPSEAVRRQVIAHFRIHPSRVVAVPLAAAKHFRPSPAPPAAPYFLFVGVLEPRKNLEMLVRAWREVYTRRGVELILAGRAGTDAGLPAPEKGLHLAGEIPDEKLPGLYSGALACLYPSMYEGFGLPVLEAMQCGAAVIAARDPAISEVAGDAAILIDAGDERAWAAALTMAVECPQSLADFRERARARARLFSWDRTARLTHDVYLEAVRRFGG